MSISTSLIRLSNRIFPKVQHPFNMQNEGGKTYAEWQFEKGQDTIKLFLDKYTVAEMFEGKRVLDMGCGAAGKSLYYASVGAKSVTGVELVVHYEAEANALAKKLGLADKFRFVNASALEPGFEPGGFDAVVMNDFMEHISDPQKAIEVALDMLSPGGHIYITLPPYYHPYGAHLSDAINMPWVHLFFTEKMLINAYKSLIAGLPDEKDRLNLRFSRDKNGREYYSYINKMTLKKFKKILKSLNIQPVYYREVPLRPFLAPLAKFPPTRELAVKMAVCVIEK